MHQRLETILKKYDTANQELFLKAKFLLFTIIIALCGLLTTLLYTCYTFGVFSLTVLTELIGFMIICSALVFLVRGKYFIAVHTILITAFSVVWVLMFIEPVSTIIIKLDTIVFIICILAGMPLMFFKNKTPILIYFISNLTIFLIFIIYLTQVTDLSLPEYVDYALDNIVAMVVLLVIAYNLHAIYQQVLESLRNELVERKKAEDSLKKFRIFLSSCVNSMPSVIIGINKNYTIVLWNEEAVRHTGISQSQAADKDLFEIFKQIHPLKQAIDTVMETNTISNAHKKIITASNKEISVAVTIFPLFGDHTVGAVIRMDDISERLRMEEVMIQSEKMLSLGGLAAGMAHEINNPLAGMMQNAQIVTNRLSKKMPANEKAAQKAGISIEAIQSYMVERNILDSLEHINNSGRHAAGIVNNMLSFAKKSTVLRQPEDLSAIVDNALELAKNDWNLNHSHDFKNIKITRKYDAHLRAVLCEKSKIQQVLFNVIKNASEAMNSQRPGHSNPEGKIDDSPKPEILIRLSETQETAKIEITDNGPGMDDDTRKQIFEPFFTTKDVDQGTGLGLSVSYFIVVDDHHGTMDVESTPGKGTTFIIQLPVGFQEEPV